MIVPNILHARTSSQFYIHPLPLLAILSIDEWLETLLLIMEGLNKTAIKIVVLVMRVSKLKCVPFHVFG